MSGSYCGRAMHAEQDEQLLITVVLVKQAVPPYELIKSPIFTYLVPRRWIACMCIPISNKFLVKQNIGVDAKVVGIGGNTTATPLVHVREVARTAVFAPAAAAAPAAPAAPAVHPALPVPVAHAVPASPLSVSKKLVCSGMPSVFSGPIVGPSAGDGRAQSR